MRKRIYTSTRLHFEYVTHDSPALLCVYANISSDDMRAMPDRPDEESRDTDGAKRDDGVTAASARSGVVVVVEFKDRCGDDVA